MECSISPIAPKDREPIINIFNYYVENSFAAFPESKLPYQTFDMFLQMSKGLLTGAIKDQNGKGLGKILLEFLEREERERGITTILVNISSLNTGSINFYENNGFTECGRIKKVGNKNGQIFDTVWMQKML